MLELSFQEAFIVRYSLNLYKKELENLLLRNMEDPDLLRPVQIVRNQILGILARIPEETPCK